MNNKIMGFKEVTIASTNIELIENSLGHRIPPGVIDTTALGDHILDAVEIAKIATNIELIEASRNRKPNNLTVAWAYLGLAALAIYIIVGIVYTIAH